MRLGHGGSMDIETISTPTTDEMTAGGSYIPKRGVESSSFTPAKGMQQQQIPQNTDQFFKQQLKGRASEENDIGLTISGIADGDPIGMETFDLGFFEDGTPAIVINGASVPVRHDQWMSLLTMRNKTREELQQRMQFAYDVRQAQTAIGRIIKSGADLPPGAAEVLMAQSAVDPGRATNNAVELYKSVSTGQGTQAVSKMRVEMQQFKNERAFGHMLREGQKTTQMVPNPFNPAFGMVEQVVPGTSKRDARVQRLRKEPTNAANQITLLAYERMEDFELDPTFRAAFPDMSLGFFDRVRYFEDDKFSTMSLFSRMQHLAANNGGDFPVQIPIQNPGFIASASFGQNIGSYGSALKQYRDYLGQLDQFAMSLGYDASSPETLDLVAQHLMSLATDNMQQQPQGQQQSQPAPQPSARPRATR
jgi:hypothetical protein